MADFLHLIADPTHSCLRAAALPNLAVIAAQGADAVAFLHGQLSQDVQALADGQARLAGYCTAKGRLLATMVIWQAHDAGEPEVRMLVRADLAATLVKRLSLFVLRAKVKLRIAPLAVSGVQASAAHAQIIEQALGVACRGQPWQRVHLPHGDWITAPSADPERLRGWWVADAPADTAPLDTNAASDQLRWDAEDIAAGLPWISAATQDLFIPQTVNLDLIDGVNFGKGCYPGQEVVARSHYRGVIKRRMMGGRVADVTSAALPGVDVFEPGRPDQPCGRIVAAASVDGATRVLFEAPFDAVDAGGLRVGTAHGAMIQLVSLPYAVRG